ncbi:uncharacterized protein MYCGRDRAFT_41575 [Zymoseptoria tritici IPO323]|uniref:ribonuclease H n=1 Tax=Zymoseptoria tritici (strain CBS 115943 / IPO323) TaxID=336722 RepID=F9XCJ7_ZYMTI|nr:uncharacterized protein MYCGRDRAFT_41575 [Zymoseptoria tritici IPO323]EGP87580.1 hypothetical protein MYCGRDRAFT_41575 [Zymoseptoria tritici IPO323]
MVYTMVWYVDGGCRRNGQPGAVAAAAAVEMLRGGRAWTFTRDLEQPCWQNDFTAPTTQRAEITAIILALEQALEGYDRLDTCPQIDLTIHSDFQYAVKCMDIWLSKWIDNDWINARGRPVANQDLIKEAYSLENRLIELADITYKWVPRAQNEMADAACNQALDQQEDDGYSC